MKRRKIWVIERSDYNDWNCTYSDFYPITSENTKKEAMEVMKFIKCDYDKCRVVSYVPER